MRKFFWLLILPFALSAQTQMQHKSPQEIEQELQVAEAEFKRAKDMFNPWYTGPLLTPSATMMPPANGNTQPYIFITDTYAAFDKNRKSIELPSHRVQLQGTANIQTGVTNNMDINVNFAWAENWQFDQSGGGFQDMSVVAGFLIYKQTRYVPGAKFTISETFPTGKYKNCNTNGRLLDAVGGGTYATRFGLAFSKILLWTTKHPVNLRCFFGYTVSTPVTVRGFNAYGGGFGCHGRVHPGNNFSADFGAEVSLTQRWVAALDIAYTATNETTFHGNPGTLKNGTPSAVGAPYSDNLSLAPAFEYNWNPNLGLIAGAWFSVYGRSSGNFASGIISVSYSFP